MARHVTYTCDLCGAEIDSARAGRKFAIDHHVDPTEEGKPQVRILVSFTMPGADYDNADLCRACRATLLAHAAVAP